MSIIQKLSGFVDYLSRVERAATIGEFLDKTKARDFRYVTISFSLTDGHITTAGHDGNNPNPIVVYEESMSSRNKKSIDEFERLERAIIVARDLRELGYDICGIKMLDSPTEVSYPSIEEAEAHLSGDDRFDEVILPNIGGTFEVAGKPPDPEARFDRDTEKKWK